jgi:hypothetical protein
MFYENCPTLTNNGSRRDCRFYVTAGQTRVLGNKFNHNRTVTAFINNSHRMDSKENATAAWQHTYILTDIRFYIYRSLAEYS